MVMCEAACEDVVGDAKVVLKGVVGRVPGRQREGGHVDCIANNGILVHLHHGQVVVHQCPCNRVIG